MILKAEGQGSSTGPCATRWVFSAGLMLATAGFVGAMYWLKEHGVSAGLLAGLLLGYMGLMGAAVALANRWLRRKGVVSPMRAPIRRYLWRFLPAMGLYVIVLFVSLRLYRAYDLAEPLLWLVAVAPALPLIAAIAAIGLYLKEEDDEFQRALAVASYVVATGLMLATATVWGFLEQFGLAPHVPSWSAFPLLALCLVPSQIIVYWRYR
jgi:hypothetical protein